jgi:hypothetical protein
VYEGLIVVHLKDWDEEEDGVGTSGFILIVVELVYLPNRFKNLVACQSIVRASNDHLSRGERREWWLYGRPGESVGDIAGDAKRRARANQGLN